MAALTGTADAETLKIITSQLALKNPMNIYISPNRKNIRFDVIKDKKDNIFSSLYWLTSLVREKGINTDKTIIFCNTMNDIASVVNYLMLNLGKDAFYPQGINKLDNCLLGVYHSSSWPSDKEHVMKSLKGNEGNVRVVVASTALSMGVNFPDIRFIVNWGPPRNLLDFHQEAGRAGRDNLPSHVVVFYYGQQIGQCDQEVKDFVKSTECLRTAAYKSLDKDIKSLKPGHDCCSNCHRQCRCAMDRCSMEVPLHQQCHNDPPPQSSRLTRPVAAEDKVDLKEALVELCQQINDSSAAVFDATACHGFSTQLIDDIVANCSQVFSVSDIMEYCPVYNIDHAVSVLEITQEIFLDIPNFDETIALLKYNSSHSASNTLDQMAFMLGADGANFGHLSSSSEDEDELP